MARAAEDAFAVGLPDDGEEVARAEGIGADGFAQDGVALDGYAFIAAAAEGGPIGIAHIAAEEVEDGATRCAVGLDVAIDAFQGAGAYRLVEAGEDGGGEEVEVLRSAYLTAADLLHKRAEGFDVRGDGAIRLILRFRCGV